MFTSFSGDFGTLAVCCMGGMEVYSEASEAADGSEVTDDVFRGPLGPSSWQAPSGSQGPVRVSWSSDDAGFAAEQVGYFVGCANAGGCAQTTTGDLRLRGRTFEFEIEDLVEPEFTSLSGDLLSEGWLRGTKTLTLAADDEGGGLLGLSADLDDQSVVDTPSSCSRVAGWYVSLRPCPLTRSGTWDVNTQAASDGPVTLTMRAHDVGGATTVEERTVLVDNTPPSPPTDLVVEGKQQWRATNAFEVTWEGEEEEYSPVAKVHTELCRLPDGVCEVGVRAEQGRRLEQVNVSEPGTYAFRLWLEDEAGNADADLPSSVALLKFDDVSPGPSQLTVPTRWLSAADAQTIGVALNLEDGALEPLSGVAGYSVTTDGSQPDATVDAAGHEATYHLDDIVQGITVMRARAISGSGVPSGVVAVAPLKVDRTLPTVSADGVPTVRSWHREPVRSEIMSLDQAELSGVDPAPLGRPTNEGGYLAIQVDDAAVEETRGDRARVVVSTDGHHRLRYRAFDAAGNASVEKEAVFKIDRTAPVGSFRALDPADPRAVRVDAADVASGLADGRIEYRRQGDGGFTRLATTRNGGVLSARLGDQGLAAGRYELRAVVTDVAGNEAVVDRWADGSSSAIAMPLRLEAKLTVAGTTNSGNCARSAKQRRGKGKGKGKTPHRRPARPKCRQARSKTSLALAHGKRASSTGRLVTGQGAPIDGALIVVEGQPRSSGGFIAVGTARTDAQGRFKFAIPAGPSRTVRYRYDGTNTVKPVAAQLTTKVRAAARLRVNRRRLRNGQAVRFTGRLLGKPIPRAGKLVALQAKVGRGWRTFATPRANSKGVFKHRYRFTATTGLRRYAFRAVIAREAAYPYERGVSPTVRVIVRGRR